MNAPRIALRAGFAELLCDYLASPSVPKRGKYRLAQLAAPFLDGAIVRSAQGPLLRCRFRDSTFWLAARENQQVAALLDDVGAQDLFIDVGANIGLHSCYAASRGATVVALEPSFREFRDLLRNRELLTDEERARFVSLPVAAAAEPGVVSFRINHLSHSGGSSIGGGRDDLDETLFVPSIRVDELVLQLLGAFELPALQDAVAHGRLVVKIDVEGFEAIVLRGMEGLLRDQRCRSVIVEIDRTRSTGLGIDVDVDELMSSHGYRPTLDPDQPGCFDQRYVPALD
jgi:FkbM family methyltransferase